MLATTIPAQATIPTAAQLEAARAAAQAVLHAAGVEATLPVRGHDVCVRMTEAHCCGDRTGQSYAVVFVSIYGATWASRKVHAVHVEAAEAAKAELPAGTDCRGGYFEHLHHV
jgi:hypothetical protein